MKTSLIMLRSKFEHRVVVILPILYFQHSAQKRHKMLCICNIGIDIPIETC